MEFCTLKSCSYAFSGKCYKLYRTITIIHYVYVVYITNLHNLSIYISQDDCPTVTLQR